MMTPLHILADNVTVTIVPPMEGVTTAIVAFIFACVAWPTLVKNKTQFYGAFVMILLVILFHSLNIMFGGSSTGFQVLSGSLIGLLQIGAIVLLFMACGGVSARELAGEMSRAYEVLRRGEQEKEIIIPIGSEQPKPRQQQHPVASPTDPPQTQKIDLPGGAGWPTKKPGDGGSIPME